MSAAKWGVAVVYLILWAWLAVIIASALFWFIKRPEPEMQYHGTEEDVTPIYRRTLSRTAPQRWPSADGSLCGTASNGRSSPLGACSPGAQALLPTARRGPFRSPARHPITASGSPSQTPSKRP